MNILIPEELAVAALESLASKYSVFRAGDLWKDPEQLKSVARDAETIMVRNQTQVTAELIASAPNLKAVGRLGVGLDNIDVAAASNAGVVVIAPLDANAISVAELTIGLMLALARKIPAADRSTKSGEWDRKGCMGVELDGKHLAVCGFGRIGRLVAARARVFGMKISVFDPFIASDSTALSKTDFKHCERLETALADADFVTAHSPFNPSTERMFSRLTFAAMKRGAFFINTSRGGVVNETDLLEALKKGHLGGAALDVREIEPPQTNSGFEEMTNVILLPHIGAATTEAQTRTFEAVAADLDRILEGKPASNYVNFPSPRRSANR